MITLLYMYNTYLLVHVHVYVAMHTLHKFLCCARHISPVKVDRHTHKSAYPHLVFLTLTEATCTCTAKMYITM